MFKLNLNSFYKLFSLVYIFFYLLSAKNAISENFQKEILINLESNLNKRNIDFIDKLFEDNEKELLKVEYTFGFIRVNDQLKINLHHSSLPYNG